MTHRIAYDARKAAQAVSMREPEFLAAVKAGEFPEPRIKAGKRVWLHHELVASYSDEDDSSEPDLTKL